MKEENLRDRLYREPLWPKKMTIEEAFEEGGKMARGEIEGESQYEIAARAFTRAILECAERNQEKWNKVSEKIDESKRPENRGENWCKPGKGQDLLLDAMQLFEREVADKEYREASNRIAPSMFQASHAFQIAYNIFKEEERDKEGEKVK